MHKTGFNHYSAECLVKGGGREEGVMDFVQYVFHAVLFLQADFSLLNCISTARFHNYPWAGEWQLGGPWRGLTPDDYNVDGPVIMGKPIYILHEFTYVLISSCWLENSPVVPLSRPMGKIYRC